MDVAGITQASCSFVGTVAISVDGFAHLSSASEPSLGISVCTTVSILTYAKDGVTV